jgi:plasmid stabilization system protein ParE
MAGRVTLSWTTEAKAELQDIYAYIAARDKPAAQRLVAKIRALANGLVDHPQIGRMVPEFDHPNIRERIWGDYRIVYQLSYRGIEVIALWHSAEPLEEH